METVKLKNGMVRYREEIRVNGKKIRSPLFIRKTDAKSWKNAKAVQKSQMLSHGEDFLTQTQKISLEEFSKSWLKERIKIFNSPKTYKIYEQMLRVNILPLLGKVCLQNLKDGYAVQLISSLKKKNLSSKTINDHISLVKNVLNFARRKKILLSNPWEWIQKLKSDLKPDIYWTKKEIEQFLLHNRFDPLYPLYFVALHTGMRLSELCGLCWDRIDFELNQITVSRTRNKEEFKDTTKTKLKRVIPMTPSVREILIQLMKKQLNLEFVFAETDGRPIDYGHIYRRFHKAQKRAKFLKVVHFHSLRHTFASQFMMNRGNIYDLQKILGHTSIMMTSRYAHFAPDHLQDSIKYIDFGVDSMTNLYSVDEAAPILPQRDTEEPVLSLISNG